MKLSQLETAFIQFFEHDGSFLPEKKVDILKNISKDKLINWYADIQNWRKAELKILKEKNHFEAKKLEENFVKVDQSKYKIQNDVNVTRIFLLNEKVPSKNLQIVKKLARWQPFYRKTKQNEITNQIEFFPEEENKKIKWKFNEKDIKLRKPQIYKSKFDKEEKYFIYQKEYKIEDQILLKKVNQIYTRKYKSLDDKEYYFKMIKFVNNRIKEGFDFTKIKHIYIQSKFNKLENFDENDEYLDDQTYNYIVNCSIHFDNKILNINYIYHQRSDVGPTVYDLSSEIVEKE